MDFNNESVDVVPCTHKCQKLIENTLVKNQQNLSQMIEYRQQYMLLDSRDSQYDFIISIDAFIQVNFRSPNGIIGRKNLIVDLLTRPNYLDYYIEQKHTCY